MHLYRYSRWDGKQQVFSLDEQDLMEHLGRYMLVDYTTRRRVLG